MTQEKKKQRNSFIQFSGVGLQLLITIYLFNFLGKWLFEKGYINGEMAVNLITLAGVFLGLYLVIRQVQNISKE